MDEAKKYQIAIRRALSSISQVVTKDSGTVTFSGKGTAESPLTASASGGGGGAVWGAITGTITNQTDVVSYVSSSVSGKANIASPTFTGTVVLPSTTSIGSVTNSEIAFLSGVTSAIQTQVNNKQASNANLTTIAGLTATTDNFIVSVASAWASRTPAQVKTSLILNNVENTALSTWAGSANITALGTITTGTIPAARISAGTLGAGNYTITGSLSATNINLTTEYTSTVPSSPATGSLIFSKNRARNLSASIGPVGKMYDLQPAFFSTKIGYGLARGGSTSFDFWGMNGTVNTNAGTASTTTFNGNLFVSMRRITYPTTSSAGSVGGLRNNSTQWSRGDAVGKGGFFFVVRGGISAFSSDMRGFIGFSASAAVFINADPSGFTDLIAFGFDAADTNWKFMHNDNAGVCTVIDLGVSFPCKTTATDWYEFRIYAPANGSIVYYSLERINTGDFINGSVNTNLPSSTTGLSWQAGITNNATGSLVSIDLSSIYIETEN